MKISEWRCNRAAILSVVTLPSTSAVGVLRCLQQHHRQWVPLSLDMPRSPGEVAAGDQLPKSNGIRGGFFGPPQANGTPSDAALAHPDAPQFGVARGCGRARFLRDARLA